MFYTGLNYLDSTEKQVGIRMPNKRHPTRTFVGLWISQTNKLSLQRLARLEKLSVSAYLSKLVASNLKSKSKVLVALTGSSSAQTKVSVDVASKFFSVVLGCIESVLVHPLPVELPFIC